MNIRASIISPTAVRKLAGSVEPALGRQVDILAYPYGQCSPLSEILLAREGFYATVTTIPGVNTLVKGLPQTLRPGPSPRGCCSRGCRW